MKKRKKNKKSGAGEERAKNMKQLKRKVRWIVRGVRSRINKVLLPVIGAKKLKELNARFYLHKVIDIDHPQKLNEKILYLLYNTDTSLWTRLADKYEVRNYVREKGLEDILIPDYGVYESFEEIDFDSLPGKYVLKATHGCDMNYICKNKADEDFNEIHKTVKFWLNNNLAYISLELHYLKIKPRIICEKYLESEGEIIDYKLFCCNGEVRFVEVCSERSKGPYLDIYMPDWTYCKDVIIGAWNNPKELEKPKNFEQMLKIAQILSEDIPFVRVDLYEIGNKIYFGEMTFTPATGVLFHFSEKFLKEQGELLDISGQGVNIYEE